MALVLILTLIMATETAARVSSFLKPGAFRGRSRCLKTSVAGASSDLEPSTNSVKTRLRRLIAQVQDYLLDTPSRVGWSCEVSSIDRVCGSCPWLGIAPLASFAVA